VVDAVLAHELAELGLELAAFLKVLDVFGVILHFSQEIIKSSLVTYYVYTGLYIVATLKNHPSP